MISSYHFKTTRQIFCPAIIPDALETPFYESCYELVEIVIENRVEKFFYMTERKGKIGRAREKTKEKIVSRHIERNTNFYKESKLKCDTDANNSREWRLLERNLTEFRIGWNIDNIRRPWIYLSGARFFFTINRSLEFFIVSIFTC